MKRLCNGIFRMIILFMLVAGFSMIPASFFLNLSSRVFSILPIARKFQPPSGHPPESHDQTDSSGLKSGSYAPMEESPDTDDNYITPHVYGYDENIAQGLYPFTLHTRLGDLVYYTQEDSRWADALYGEDPMITHGCGPTVLAMLTASFIDPAQNPVTMAQWAYDHHYYSKRDGSYHSIISEGLPSLGFEVNSFPGRSPESIYGALDSGCYLVALMGKGNFTANGHFILLTGITEDGLIRIADPKSFVHTQQSWDAGLLLSQLKDESGSGGPLWTVRPPER